MTAKTVADMVDSVKLCRMKKVMAMVGSLSSRSSNLAIVEYIAKAAAGRFQVEVFDGIRDLPQFNPDLDNDVPPVEVAKLRQAIAGANMLLISTPEYVFGVPGSLKNALDWTVSTADIRLKPSALIVASLSGEKAFESLLKTLETLEAEFCDRCTLLISHIKAKIGANGEISHEQTRSELASLVDAMARCLEK
jgi:NAD(P)H-dependent FMN reductase